MNNNNFKNLFEGLSTKEQDILRKALQLYVDTKNDDLTDQKKLNLLKEVVLNEI